MLLDTFERGGFIWPATDSECADAVLRTVHDAEVGLAHVTNWRACVQAGGNCGVWPKYLSGRFETVYTFEPDWRNFQCLVVNCADLSNVHKFQAALGSDVVGRAGMSRDPSNVGAHYMDGHGDILIMSLDHMALPPIGYLQLDIEGFEWLALSGAERLLARDRPVLQLELKGLGEKFGLSDDACREWLKERGYEPAATVNRDWIFKHG